MLAARQLAIDAVSHRVASTFSNSSKDQSLLSADAGTRTGSVGHRQVEISQRWTAMLPALGRVCCKRELLRVSLGYFR